MQKLRIRSSFTFSSTDEPRSTTTSKSSAPLSPLSWTTMPTSTTSSTRESLERNLLYDHEGQLGIGQVNRFTIEVSRSECDGTLIESDSQGEYIWLHLRNSELNLLRPIYITGPFSLYVDVTPHNYSHLKKFSEDIDFDADVKPGQTFKAQLRLNDNSRIKDDTYGWTVDVMSQLALTTIFHIKFSLSMGYDHHLLKKHREKPDGELISPLRVIHQDTQTIWSKPPPHPTKPAHLVILTHGIFSNVGADMLYIKDNIEEISSHTPGANVIVRGYDNNVGKSERGIKYLGKRVAEFVLETVENSEYDIDRISFVGHSLGGPVQAYAVAHIQWNRPDFFKKVVPVNFIIMASPMLGITEFPKAFSMALDLGILGLTGRDLTLRRKLPSVIKKNGSHEDPAMQRLTTKPVLEQIIQSSAHQIFEKFVSRTLYANAVHDGIVPLRTSALLYLDWKGLGDLEALRKEYDNKTDTQVAGHGEQNADDGKRAVEGTVSEIPKGAIQGENQEEVDMLMQGSRDVKGPDTTKSKNTRNNSVPSINVPPLLKKPSSFFVDVSKKKKRKRLRKYLRTQTVDSKTSGTSRDIGDSSTGTEENTSSDWINIPDSEADIVRDIDQGDNSESEEDDNITLNVPPVASTMLTAANVLRSPEPEQEYLTDPDSRTPQIFHDKTYSYSDLPKPHYSTKHTLKIKKIFSRHKKALQEQLARSWHYNMEWRKVLVTLKPDAHNNIAVRRKYVNAWGWGVVDHLVESHFGNEALVRELEMVERFKREQGTL